jgi:ParB-like chromosome segregation protein Spo0J
LELWPIDRLRPYDRNPRTHSDDQVVQIAASMVEFGWTNPILIDETDGILAGHGRLQAAKHLGLSEVPVVPLSHLSEAQKRAYILADNQLALQAGWDEQLLAEELAWLKEESFDLDLIGFEDGELDRLLALEAAGDRDGGVAPLVVPEPPRNPVSRPGDLWLLGQHRLLCGDSTRVEDVRRLMRDERASLFATDPPYLVDYDGSNHPTRNKDWSPSYGVTWDDASQGAELYEGFIRAAVEAAIAEDAAWYCWHASRRQAMLEAVWQQMGAFVHQQIIWMKDRGVLTRSHYLWKHEPCFYGWIKGKRPPHVAEDRPASVWEIASLYGEDRPDHPTPKPLACFAIPMRQHVARGGLCYEPFCGSGSQIMAGEAVDRRVYAMEISPAYVDVAILRWQAETGRDAVLDGEALTFADAREQRLGADDDEVAAA